MNPYVRTLAVVLAASSLALTGVASAQRAATPTDTDAPLVTWKDVPTTTLRDSSASAGSKVVKDPETGRLRPARAGELPDVAPRVPTEIINFPGGGILAIAGDDLMVDSIAVKQADGSLKIGHDAGADPAAEVK